VVEVEDSCTAEHKATAPPPLLPARGKATTAGSLFPKSGAAEHLHTAALPAGELLISLIRVCKG
jgi:hypothetical protein